MTLNYLKFIEEENYPKCIDPLAGKFPSCAVMFCRGCFRRHKLLKIHRIFFSVERRELKTAEMGSNGCSMET